MEKSHWSRRKLLKLCGLLLGSTVTAGGAGALFWYLRDNALRVARVAVGNGELTNADMQEVLALAHVLYPARDEAERLNLEQAVRDWTAVRTAEDGRYPAYQGGAVSLREAAQREGYASFHAAPVEERDRLLRTLCPYGAQPPPSLQERAYLAANPEFFRARTHTTALVRDLVNGIYTSQVGWGLLGYSSRPGFPTPLMAYTEPPPSP